MKSKIVLFSILALSSSLFAMEEKIPVKKLNETIIVTGENFGTKTRNVAKNIQVITKEEIKEKGARNILEALKGVPGVIVRDYEEYGLSTKIDLRGNGGSTVCSSGTAILLDGVPMNGIVSLDIKAIPIEEIEKIEIIQGGGVITYGDGSFSGVVNIITKSTANKKNKGSVGLEIGSWKTRKATVDYSTKLTDKFSLGLAYSDYSSLGYRDRNIKYKNKKNKTKNIFLRTKYDLDDGYIKLSYNHTDKKKFYTSALSEKQFKENHKQAGRKGGGYEYKKDLWNLSVNKKLNDKFEFLIQGGYAKYKNKKSKTSAKEYFVKPEIRYNYNEGSFILLGADFRDGKAKDDLRKSNAIYLKNKTTLNNFEFTQGYRKERVKYNYSITAFDWSTLKFKKIPKKAKYTNDSFDLGLNYLYSDSGNIYFNYTRANRTPDLGEMWLWDHKNAKYEIQKNNIFEIGLRDTFKNTSINTSLFYTVSKNEIYFDLINGASFYDLKIKNLDGKLRRVGAQLSLKHDFDKLILKENISYIKAKVKSGKHEGNEFPGIPNWTVNLGATYKFTDNLVLNVDGYYQSSEYAEDDIENRFGKLNSYTTIDTNLSYKLNNGLELYAGVKNLFDRKYAMVMSTFEGIPGVEYYPANGRSYYTGFKYTF